MMTGYGSRSILSYHKRSVAPVHRTDSFSCGKSILFLLSTLLLLVPSLLHAQAWTRDSGQVYLKLAYGSSTASEQYTFDGSVKEYADNVEENAFFDRSIYLYGEAGLTPDLTLVASLPYKRVIIRDAAFRYRTYAFGDLGLGVRHTLNDLFGFRGTANSAAVNLGATIPLGYTRNYAPSAGAGQINLELGLSAGRSFYPFPGYVQGGVGYRHRSSLFLTSSATDCAEGVDRNCFADTKPSFGDELYSSLESGVTIAERLFLQGILASTWSLKGPETGFTVTNPVPTRQRFVKVGFGSAVMLPAGITTNVQGFYTIAGQNSVRSFDLFLGVDVKFNAF